MQNYSWVSWYFQITFWLSALLENIAFSFRPEKPPFHEFNSFVWSARSCCDMSNAIGPRRRASFPAGRARRQAVSERDPIFPRFFFPFSRPFLFLWQLVFLLSSSQFYLHRLLLTAPFLLSWKRALFSQTGFPVLLPLLPIAFSVFCFDFFVPFSCCVLHLNAQYSSSIVILPASRVRTVLYVLHVPHVRTQFHFQYVMGRCVHWSLLFQWPRFAQSSSILLRGIKFKSPSLGLNFDKSQSDHFIDDSDILPILKSFKTDWQYLRSLGWLSPVYRPWFSKKALRN